MIVEPIPAAVLPLAEQHGAGVPLKFGEGSQEPEPAPVLTAALSDHCPGLRCWRLTLAAGFWRISARSCARCPYVARPAPSSMMLDYLGRRPRTAHAPGSAGTPAPPTALSHPAGTHRGKPPGRHHPIHSRTQHSCRLWLACGPVVAGMVHRNSNARSDGDRDATDHRCSHKSHSAESSAPEGIRGPSMAGSDLTMPPGELIQNLGGANCEPSSGRATTKWRSSAPAKLALPVWRCGKYREMEVTNSFAPSIPQRRLKRSTGWLT